MHTSGTRASTARNLLHRPPLPLRTGGIGIPERFRVPILGSPLVEPNEEELVAVDLAFMPELFSCELNGVVGFATARKHRTPTCLIATSSFTIRMLRSTLRRSQTEGRR